MRGEWREEALVWTVRVVAAEAVVVAVAVMVMVVADSAAAAAPGFAQARSAVDGGREKRTFPSC